MPKHGVIYICNECSAVNIYVTNRVVITIVKVMVMITIIMITIMIISKFG